MSRPLVLFGWLALVASASRAGEVRGRVEMPETCSPSVSPAVVTLEPAKGPGGPAPSKSTGSTSVALVNQHGLQFEPRVQVARVGETIRFTNQDAETHNVHILTPGFDFNRSMKPGVPAEYVPAKAGLVRLVCDIHAHMRGFVVVTDSPWAKVCKGGSGFTFRDVPDGRYVLYAWHEMGEPLRREVEVRDGEAVDLGTLTLKGYPIPAKAPIGGEVRAWPEVVDRIGVLLAESAELARVKTPAGLAKARKRVEDAYWGEFETSDMETAIRRHLGVRRAGGIEGQFLGLRSAIKDAVAGKVPMSEIARLSGKLLFDLSKASEELKALKVFDRRDVGNSTNAAEPASLPGASEQAGKLAALAASFEGVRGFADEGRPLDAASAMTDAYFDDFEPLERLLNVRRPQDVKPLEVRFNAIQGRLNSGLKGPELASELAALRGEVVAAIDRCDSAAAGSFGLAFANSLVTILREGVEVILLLTMLVALVAKTKQPRAMSAIGWGVGVAVFASALTALGLNLLVASSRGKTREVVEGLVMMAAAGVLFYVSYWLISQTQARRWAEFLKGKVAEGAKLGGLWTLGVTAFLAVYREGAETALLYQALISGQGGSREGLVGLLSGLGVGLALLAVVAFLIRKSSVKLPLRPFFKVTGFVLFAMAVVFAGNGVFELQMAGYLKTTAVSWLGSGLPALGIHPNTQSLSIQGLLLAGAAFALVAPALEGKPRPAPVPPRPPAGVGV